MAEESQGKSNMVEVKDIAASVSASMSEATTGTFQTKFGNNVKNLGSGSVTLRVEETDTFDSKAASDAKATSATAKSGDGGYSDATAVMQSQGDASVGGDGIPQWAIYAALGIAGIGVISIGAILIFKGGKK